ncbi:MAG: AMP-dependent synthetase [Deltaproteobacteria bacterium CG_4_8_14_3_um_filter_45_9]|nr:MAG: AMP-dependent synthetase [Deltaproteobacteria bacterium CG03_land_8_20_14_0_80_45_14]PIX23206.1 MAG: AMP-dependent synthetase [Deltaproteobacteria bacterium CG_4_8_14_3_um_filter_45_9]
MQWNIGYIAKKRSILTPNKPAILYEDRPITYKELNEGVNRFAHYLKEAGIRKGDHIAVFLRNCPEFFEIYFATAKLGIVFVSLNFRLVGPELEYQLNHSGSRMLIFHDDLAGIVNTVRPKVRVEKFVSVKSGEHGVAERFDWAENYHEIIKYFPTDEPLPDKPIDRDDPLAVIYTSGVEGVPKGAVLSHLQTYFKCFQVILYTDMRADDLYLTQLPLFHSGGIFCAATPTLCRGATYVMRQRFDPEKFVEDIERYRATIIFALTAMWRIIFQTGKLDHVDLSSVRCVLGGGEKTPLSMIDELTARGLFMQQVYGQTENSLMMVLPREDVLRKKGSIGLPGFFTEVFIGNERGNELPPGQIGEMEARGPTVMTGYLGNPELTAQTIVDGILHTGDLGYRDEEGYFYIVDRAKDMYRSGGENVYPAEVEKVLLTHPEILQVAIIGVPDDKWGETGKAFILPKQGAKLTREEVLQFLQGKVAKFKFPTYVEFLSELPMTSSGKIKKVELKEKYGVKLSESFSPKGMGS